MEAIAAIGKGHPVNSARIKAPKGRHRRGSSRKDMAEGKPPELGSGLAPKPAWRTCGHGDALMVAGVGMRMTRLNRDASKLSKRFAEKLLCESGSSAAEINGESACDSGM